jgi:hypothetical protein
MMTDVEPNLADTPGLFETLIMKKNIPLFFGCTFFSKMTATFKLYNLKAKNGWSDKSFDSLFDLLREMLPEKNELSESTYRARRMLCPLSMKAEKIPVCRNDCILF